MDKQQKNVYPNQPQSVNHNVMNPLHLPQAQATSSPMHPYAAQQHFYQVPHQQFMMHSQPSYPYNVPSQQFMMGPPPPYSTTAPPAYSMAPPHHMYPAAMPAGYSVPIQTQAPRTAIFDAGARFNNKGPVNIPPPPPGYLPNAAQIASMQGQSVIVEKKTNNFFTGGKGAGYTFW